MLRPLGIQPSRITRLLGEPAHGDIQVELQTLRQRGVGWQEGGVAGLIVINLVLSVVVPGISLGGHLGGLIVGSALGAVMLRSR